MNGRFLRKRGAIACVIGALWLSACGAEPAPNQDRAEFEVRDEPDGPAAPGQPATGPAGILNFTAPKLGGGKLVGSEFAGQNLAVWFWAPW